MPFAIQLALDAAATAPLPVTLASVRTFPTSVVYLAPRHAPLPLRGRLDRIGMVEFCPVKQLCAFPLGVRPA